MIFLNILNLVDVFDFLCWLVFTLAVYALPLFAGVTALFRMAGAAPPEPGMERASNASSPGAAGTGCGELTRRSRDVFDWRVSDDKMGGQFQPRRDQIVPQVRESDAEGARRDDMQWRCSREVSPII